MSKAITPAISNDGHEHAGQADTQILQRDNLPEGGFAGIREHRLVMDGRLFRASKDPMAWDGIGRFVYMADARFIPRGETGLHPHRGIDIISIMVDGRITHHGTLGDGQEIAVPHIQLQTSGRAGFEHNEVNPDDTANRMIQMWVVPEHPIEPARFQVIRPVENGITRVYGGDMMDGTPPTRTIIEVVHLHEQQVIKFEGPLLAYLFKGSGQANCHSVAEGDLVRTTRLQFSAGTEAQLVVVRSLA